MLLQKKLYILLLHTKFEPMTSKNQEVVSTTKILLIIYKKSILDWISLGINVAHVHGVTLFHHKVCWFDHSFNLNKNHQYPWYMSKNILMISTFSVSWHVMGLKWKTLKLPPWTSSQHFSSLMPHHHSFHMAQVGPPPTSSIKHHQATFLPSTIDHINPNSCSKEQSNVLLIAST